LILSLVISINPNIMKKLLLFLFFQLFIFSNLFSQCPPGGNISLRSQSSIDNYAVNYPDCTEPINIDIDESQHTPITNLNGLSMITKVRGHLFIGHTFGTHLIDMKGLESITKINNSLMITNNPELISLSGLESLTEIGGALILGWDVQGDNGNPKLENLLALQKVNYIGDRLEIKENHSLTDLAGLEAVKTIGGNIEISYNDNLTNLNGLNNIENVLLTGDYIVESNPLLLSLNNFQNLKEVHGVIEINFNPLLQSLQGLNTLERTKGYIDDDGYLESGWVDIFNNNSLVNLQGLNSLRHVDYAIDIDGNDNLENLSGLDNLATVKGRLGITGNPKLLTLSSLDNVTYIEELDIIVNELLINLDGLNNISSNVMDGIAIVRNNELLNIHAISKMNLNNSIGVTIYDNPQLSICNELNICEYLNNGGNYNIRDNSPGCNSFEEVIESCANNFNFISGVIKLDADNNGCDASDTSIANLKVKSTDGTNNFITFTNSEGAYSLSVNQGDYNTSIINSNSYFNISPNSQESNFTGVGNTDVIDFCLTSNQSVNDVNITIIPLTDSRPGFDSSYQIVYENIGTTISNGSLELQFDSAKLTFLDAIPSQNTMTSNALSWNYIDLLPFENRSIEVNFNVSPPPTNNIDDVLTFNLNISSSSSDINPIDNVFELKQTLIGSIDPNDKTVLQGESITIEDIGEYLHYVIRFQNTGTASAINVRITDVLDENLDWDTFKPISMSHDGRVQINEDREVEFTFTDINLPDSISNEAESHGFVAFKIKPKSSLIEGDFINGNAKIYFDFNLPVETNTVSTEIIGSALGVSENTLENYIRIRPNPTKDIISIELKNGIDILKVQVYSILGKTLLEQKEQTNRVDLNHLENGIYFLRVYTDNGNITKKILKK